MGLDMYIYKQSEKYRKLEEKYRELQKSIHELEKELQEELQESAYWRKYNDLNDYILEELTIPEGDGNLEYLPITRGDTLNIKEFIVKDDQDYYNDTTQIDSILDNWDDTATYVYHPWW